MFVRGGTLVAADVIHSDALAMANERLVQTEGGAWWMPWIFSGMPGFPIHWEGPRDYGIWIAGVLLMMAVGARSVRRDEDIGWGILGGYVLAMLSMPFGLQWYPAPFLLGFVVLIYYETDTV